MTLFTPLFLAQSTVQVLPSPPLVTRLILEDPLLLTAALIVAAIAAFFIYNARQKTKAAMAWCATGLALAAGVQILAFAITTDREKIIAATTPLVSATAAGDAARLDPMLDSTVRLTNDFNLAADELPHGQGWDKAQILAQVRSYLGEKWRIKEAAILEVQGIIDGEGRGRTQVRVRATPDVTEFPIISWWRLDWKKSAKGAWLVTGIQPIDVGLPSRFR